MSVAIRHESCVAWRQLGQWLSAMRVVSRGDSYAMRVVSRGDSYAMRAVSRGDS